MSEKRRDSKTRILQTGESQRKDGRYAYKYIDVYGKQKFLYAWKLVPTDKTPAGKREDLSLREKERELQKDLDDGIDTAGKKMTVCELYAMQIRHNGNVKPNTKTGRSYLLKIIKEDQLGGRSIDSVKMSDAKEWVLRMKENGYAFKTIKNYKRSLSAAFYSAIQNDCIRKNPFEFDITDVIEDDTQPKEALSIEQEHMYLAFVKNDDVFQVYYDDIVILLGTGLRISELCGLTVSDLDFENRIIDVNHQILYDGKIGYYISMPKTKKGYRQIPMSETVYQALLRVVSNRKRSSFEIVDNGKVYKDFLFCKDNGNPHTSSCYNSVFSGIKKKYNASHEVKLTRVTSPHTMRHTFCTRMANAGMNPKSLQYLMGHANISMTLNYYAHATYESAKTEFDRIMGGKQAVNLPAMAETVRLSA
ncbi:MAG: tyrosine-type recombinase/integrase [Monoglobales bacterium]